MATVERTIVVSGNDPDRVSGVSLPNGDMKKRAKAIVSGTAVAFDIQMTTAEISAVKQALAGGGPATVLLTITKV